MAPVALAFFVHAARFAVGDLAQAEIAAAIFCLAAQMPAAAPISPAHRLAVVPLVAEAGGAAGIWAAAGTSAGAAGGCSVLGLGTDGGVGGGGGAGTAVTSNRAADDVAGWRRPLNATVAVIEHVPVPTKVTTPLAEFTVQTPVVDDA